MKLSGFSRIGLALGVLCLGAGSVVYALHHRSAAKLSAQHALAPDFSLPQLSGEPLTLSAYRGKVVLLDFWATWCEPCREEIPHFVELQNRYRAEGLQIIGISMDDGPQPVRDFYRQFKMNYPVVMGTVKVAEQYGGVLGLPIAFLIERDGHIYAKHIGTTDKSVFESEIVRLLGQNGDSGTRRAVLISTSDLLRPLESVQLVGQNDIVYCDKGEPWQANTGSSK